MNGKLLNGMQARAARAMAGLSQQDVADQLGVQRRVILDFEAGTSVPREATLKKLEALFSSLGIEAFDGPDGSKGVLMSSDGADRVRLRRLNWPSDAT
jgi:ribosome-binding protein aMBF1 (putative translation factor)